MIAKLGTWIKKAKDVITSETTKSDQFSLVKGELYDGTELYFSHGDITVVVGPNNSGKSTFLREIYTNLRNHKKNRILFRTLAYSAADEDSIGRRLSSYYNILSEGNVTFILRGENDRVYLPEYSGGPSDLSLGDVAGAFIAFLNSEKRLQLSRDVQTIDIGLQKPSHPFHVFMLNSDVLRRFSKRISEAFLLDFTITRIGNPIRGYVGGHFSHDDSLSADQHIPSSGEPISLQGDGLRSYAGILSEIQAMDHPIVLLDEPEAFLHPPQAKRLARTLVRDLTTNRQAFIATHSTHFLQGVLSDPSNRVKVIRLDRSKGSTKITQLDNALLKDAVSHPAIANSNLLDSLFFDETIICEADADCKIFEWITKDAKDASPDRFWYSTGGKHQFAKIGELLSSFGLNWKAIVDPDILLDWDLLMKLVTIKGGDLSTYKSRVLDALKLVKSPDLENIRSGAIEALQNSSDAKSAINTAIKLLETKKVSTPLKTHGLDAIPNGQQRSDINFFVDELVKLGICILPKGELETYVPTVGNHGPAWVSTILDSPLDFKSELETLKRHIGRILN